MEICSAWFFKNSNKFLFRDLDVVDVNLKEDQTLKIEINGGWLIEDKETKEINNTILTFQKWESFEVRRCNLQIKMWEFVPLDKLKEICEMETEKKTHFLRGFGKVSGLWLEYQIINPFIEIQFTD